MVEIERSVPDCGARIEQIGVVAGRQGERFRSSAAEIRRVPLLLCAVEGVLVDFAADAWDSAVGLILPEMPGARAVLHAA